MCFVNFGALNWTPICKSRTFLKMYLFIYAVKSQYIVEMDRQWVGSGEGGVGVLKQHSWQQPWMCLWELHTELTLTMTWISPQCSKYILRGKHMHTHWRERFRQFIFFSFSVLTLYKKTPFVNSPCHFAVTSWHAQTFVQLGRSGIGTCPRSKGLERKSFSIEPGITFWGKQLFPRNLLMSQNIFTFSAPGLALWNWS